MHTRANGFAKHGLTLAIALLILSILAACGGSSASGPANTPVAPGAAPAGGLSAQATSAVTSTTGASGATSAVTSTTGTAATSAVTSTAATVATTAPTAAGPTPTVPSISSVKVGAPGTVTITVVRGAMMDTMNKLAAKYEQSHPGTKIQVVEEPEGGAFQALIAAGNQPDVVVLSVGTQVGQLAAEQALIPLESMPGAADILNNLEPAIAQPIYGHSYYAPIGADVTMMIYNKQLFQEAKLDPNKPPVTWDQFLAAAKAIQALPARSNGDKVYGTVFWNEALTYGGWYWNTLQPIYLNGNQNQCGLMNKLGTDIVFDQPQCKMADFFTFARNAQQYAPPTMEKSFFSRDIGMWLQYGYSWEPNLKTAANQPMVIGQDVGIAPVPVPAQGDTSYSTYGGRLLGIMKTTPDRQNRAWDFVKFLLQNDTTLQFDKDLGYLPVNKQIANDPYFQDPSRKPFVDQLKNSVLPAQYAAADKVDNAVLAEYQKVVVAKSVDPAKGVTEAATAARAALKQQ